MAPTFHRFTVEDFRQLLAGFQPRRTITAVHLHHTWRPNHSQFRGHDSIVSMWHHHTVNNGWSDLAQHITIDPEGRIWSGRHWDRAPASASGFNGNAHAGPFMIEVIGDFDQGQDPFAGDQRQAVIDAVAHLHNRFQLAEDSLRFHNEMSGKTCPGSSIDRQEFLKEIRRRAKELRSAEAGPAERARSPFGAEAHLVRQILEQLQEQQQRQRQAPVRDDPADAELAEQAMPAEALRALSSVEIATVAAPGVARAGEREQLTPEVLTALRPHVINSRAGRFSSSGLFATAQGDVDAIFDDHLEGAVAGLQGGDKLRLVFFAHGGLVPEARGLLIAHDQLAWWRRNKVYPIHFVWETGLFEILGQMLTSARQIARRDVFDFTTDPLIESLARRLGGVQVWSGMKSSAERGVGPQGAAEYTAQKLAAFCARHDGRVELHGVGHSAGAIFHAYFIPAALRHNAPAFQSLHFLAPAITAQAFHERLDAQLGGGIKSFTMFTMKQDWERDDSVFAYRKSLLYLIHHALEPEHEEPILGLEESVRASPELRGIFGLQPDGVTPRGEVIWSKSVATGGRSASTSTTHGGFDNDPPTMNSMLRRILGVDDTQPIAEFPRESRGSRVVDLRALPDRLPEDLMAELGTMPGAVPPGAPTPVPGVMTQRTAAGRRRALCIGIDTYPPGAELAGCVADANAWSRALVEAGFEQPDLLLNHDATRAAMLAGLTDLVRSSRPGDVVVFQYAGHGTYLPDLDGDEDDDRDEALCPVDYDTGAFLIDDDLRELFATLADGVNLTVFLDSCHSGTATRFAVGARHGGGDGDVRPRFMRPTPEMAERHQRFRSGSGGTRSARSGTPDTMRQVVFAACQPHEVAYEVAGQGEFTQRALPLLRQAISGATNDAFYQGVVAAFGAAPRQRPHLDCAPAASALAFLAPLTTAAGAPAGAPLAALAPGLPGPGSSQSLGQFFVSLGKLLDGR